MKLQEMICLCLALIIILVGYMISYGIMLASSNEHRKDKAKNILFIDLDQMQMAIEKSTECHSASHFFSRDDSIS